MKTIYGGQPKNPPAYCRHHHGYVTVAEMKKHECLRKQCRHLCKYEDHEYWTQRENLKKKKKARKAALDAQFAS